MWQITTAVLCIIANFPAVIILILLFFFSCFYTCKIFLISQALYDHNFKDPECLQCVLGNYFPYTTALCTAFIVCRWMLICECGANQTLVNRKQEQAFWTNINLPECWICNVYCKRWENISGEIPKISCGV